MNNKYDPQNNYVDKLKKLSETGLSAGVYVAKVEHDDWCMIFMGEQCNCDPDVNLQKITEKQI